MKIDSTHRRADTLTCLEVGERVGLVLHDGVGDEPHLDLGLEVDLAVVVRKDRVLAVGEAALDDVAHVQRAVLRKRHTTVRPRSDRREREDAHDHVLRRRRERTAVCRRLDVVGREHEDAGLGLGLGGKRQVNGHLVAVEVRVERGGDQRRDADGLALHEHRLEGLDAQTMQRRRAVEHDGMLRDDLFEDIPDFLLAALDHALGALDVLRVLEVHEPLHHERLEELQRHGLGQTALVQLELRAHDDDRTAGVVHALAQQVLAEAALLALEHVGQRLERTVAGARDGTPAAAVVEQRVHGLLQHPLLVVHDDLQARRGQGAA